MSKAESIVVGPGPDQRSVRTADGKVIRIPDGWDLLEPGDATITRRVKAAGPSYTVQQRKGRKIFTRGVWAPKETIDAVVEEVGAERSTEQYAKRKAAGERRREKTQNEYVVSFRDSILAFLAFDPQYRHTADQLADAVAIHATPIGSGTVARTKRIPIERRAEAAVIAWMRHATTNYDHRRIARIRGERREVRRELARESKRLLSRYRRGETIDAVNCPLQQALARKPIEPAVDDDEFDLDD